MLQRNTEKPSPDVKDYTIVNEENVTQPSTTCWPHVRYYQVTEQWQRSVCARMPELQYVSRFVCTPGGPDVVLTRPNLRRLRTIMGDGNCLFRALAYIITGSENQHYKIRTLIISHMLSNSHMVIGNGPDGRANYASGMQDHDTIEEYI